MRESVAVKQTGTDRGGGRGRNREKIREEGRKRNRRERQKRHTPVTLPSGYEVSFTTDIGRLLVLFNVS